jgi:small subunit ribosomal protein S17
MKERGSRKKKIGLVVSDKMDKSVVVEVERRFIDPMYKKIVKRKKRYKAHDERNECHIGDKVLLMETRPLSRDKRWRVASIMKQITELQED